MSASAQDVFADTAYWIALLIQQDRYHEKAQAWSLRVTGNIVTTAAVLTETANALASPRWRAACAELFALINRRPDVVVVPCSPELWDRGVRLYTERQDKGWGLTDCMSFLVMGDAALDAALTSDAHFRQAGFQALLLQDE